MTSEPVASSRLIVLATSAALVLALGLGVFLGVRLGERASRADARELSLVDPAGLATYVEDGARSPAGFTGFGGPPALQGEVLRAGRTAAAGPGHLELVDEAARTEVTYAGTQRLYRIEPARDALASGDSVIVRVDGTRALGVLRARLEGASSPR
jgi:hypothetical protein